MIFEVVLFEFLSFLSVKITICANQISVKNEQKWLSLDLAITCPIVMKSILKCQLWKYENSDCEQNFKEILEVLH